MKTTVDIAGSLLSEARRVANREQTTLKSLVEEGLQRVLKERKSEAPFRLRKASFKGQGLKPHIGEGSWERLRDIVYEGRGA